MRNRIICCLLLLIVVLSLLNLSSEVSATKWGAKEVICPICKTTNAFRAIMSYGGYIYNWPSKFQFIFWPLTHRFVLYSCKKCYLTCYMWDFEKIPKEKHEEIKKQLEGVTFDQDYDDYAKIPMSQRLYIAEKVYSVLDRDDEFWCQFYRVMGYHFEEEKKQEEADKARKKALNIAERMLGRKENAGIRKELFLISGAMRHFLKDEKGALHDFKKALRLKYKNKSIPKKQAESKDKYLSELLKEYITEIQNTEKAKDSK